MDSLEKASAVESELVYMGIDGRLAYVPDSIGYTIPDFSYAGYMGGCVAIPDVEVKDCCQRAIKH